MGFNPFKAAKDFVEDEVVNKIKYPIEDAFKDLGDYLVELGDDFGDWVRGDTPEIPGGTLTTTYADPSKLPVIYGTRKTGGRFIFEITADTVDVDPPNEHLRFVVLYCESGDHGILGFGEHYFNDIPVSSGEFDGFYTITEFTGAPGQRLPTSIINKLPGWVRGTHTLDGWAGRCMT
jgi:hypothetical protein